MGLIVKILTGLIIAVVFLKYHKLQKKFQEIALYIGAVLVALGLIGIIVNVLTSILEAILKIWNLGRCLCKNEYYWITNDRKW